MYHVDDDVMTAVCRREAIASGSVSICVCSNKHDHLIASRSASMLPHHVRTDRGHPFQITNCNCKIYHYINKLHSEPLCFKSYRLLNIKQISKFCHYFIYLSIFLFVENKFFVFLFFFSLSANSMHRRQLSHLPESLNVIQAKVDEFFLAHLYTT